jgi:hypothetical protein
MKDMPAFPLEVIYTQENEKFNGMTLRDYFAAQAMQVVMPSVIAELQRKSYSDEKTKLLKNTSAEACYGMADAMMKAREA